MFVKPLSFLNVKAKTYSVNQAGVIYLMFLSFSVSTYSVMSKAYGTYPLKLHTFINICLGLLLRHR